MLSLILATIALLITAYYVLTYWYRIYNKLQRLLTKAENHYANIPVIMQKRQDNINALVQITGKYHEHEYETIRDTIKERGQHGLNNVGLNAVIEKYPELKADNVFSSLMNRDSQIEGQLNQARMGYNHSARLYNEFIRQFPINIVANYHSFEELGYLRITPEGYKPQNIFN